MRPLREAQDGERRQAPRARPGCRRSDIPPSLWILPPRTPIVSTTGTPQAAILLPSHTPPVGCQAIGWPRSAPACLTSSNSALGLGRQRLGRAAEAAVDLDLDVVLGRDRRDASAIDAVRRAPRRRASAGRKLTRRIARSGTTLLGLPPSIRDGLTVRPRRLRTSSRSARSAAASNALRPSSGLRPAWAERPRTTKREIAAPGPRSGERAVGQRRRLIGQRGALARAARASSAAEARRARLPRRC